MSVVHDHRDPLAVRHAFKTSGYPPGFFDTALYRFPRDSCFQSRTRGADRIFHRKGSRRVDPKFSQTFTVTENLRSGTADGFFPHQRPVIRIFVFRRTGLYRPSFSFQLIEKTFPVRIVDIDDTAL